MLNLKALLTKICQELVVTTGTLAITTTAGTMNSATYYKFRHVVHVVLTYSNSASIASGSNIVVGTLTTTALRPMKDIGFVTYYGKVSQCGTLTTAGALTITNASVSSLSMGTNTSTAGFTYIVA